jgi:surface antigen
MCYQRGDCFLVSINTGVIRDSWWRDERENYWRRRYSRFYTYDDDIYYRECRNRPDPAGILVGGLIGGLLGQAADSDDGAGSTFAGIIIGSMVGAALTRDLDCDDRSYAYYAYYHGLNSDRPGIYRWRNPRNRHHGEFHVRSYYYDGDGFRCANYRHTVWLESRREARGRTCRQPDGAWAFLD